MRVDEVRLRLRPFCARDGDRRRTVSWPVPPVGLARDQLLGRRAGVRDGLSFDVREAAGWAAPTVGGAGAPALPAGHVGDMAHWPTDVAVGAVRGRDAWRPGRTTSSRGGVAVRDR